MVGSLTSVRSSERKRAYIILSVGVGAGWA